MSNSNNGPSNQELQSLLRKGLSGNEDHGPPPPPSGKSPPPSYNRLKSPPDSRTTSRTNSPTGSDTSDELPNNVSEVEQLDQLPRECLSGEDETKRPLRHVDETNEEFRYSLRPMTYSVIFILLIELLERFAFYGVNYTQTSYLTGAYDEDWNAGMESVSASTYVSVSVAVAYTTPFFGAILADRYLGDYWAILVGALVFYIPGLFMIAFTTVPGLLGHAFNRSALSFGLLFLWPVGTGIVKSVVNVFGAKQFHPLLQSSLIEAYYVKFYMCINIGALIGGVMVPVIAQSNVTLAYFLPVAMLTLGVSLFAMGTPRYVRPKPKAKPDQRSKAAAASKFIPPTGDGAEDLNLLDILKISILIIPFNIAYSQMATTFIVQGTVMEKAFFGWIDAACMNNADAVAVLVFGSAVGDYFYPWLAQRNIKIPTTYKFAIGSLLGSLAIAWAILVEYRIHAVYARSGDRISILWQALSFFLIGAGEIFAVSAAYEAAFTASPPEMKVLASAVNLFCIGGLPNVICIFLYHVCEPWFRNSMGTSKITHPEDYTSAHVGLYFVLLLVISLIGVGINVIPGVKRWVESVEDRATEMIKTPKTPRRPPRKERSEFSAADESPLLRAKRHQAYLKYGSGPQLFKSGSFRAGQSLSQRSINSKKIRPVRRSVIQKLYDPIKKGVVGIIGGSSHGGSSGQPIQKANLLPPKSMSYAPTSGRDGPGDPAAGPFLARHNSN